MKMFLRAIKTAGLILLPVVLGLLIPGLLGFAEYWFKEGQPFRDYRTNNAIARALGSIPLDEFQGWALWSIVIAFLEVAVILSMRRRRRARL